LGFKNNLTEKGVELSTNDFLSINEMTLIRNCLVKGVSCERIKKYVKPEFSENYCYYVDEDDYAEYYSIIGEAIKGIESGLTDEQISVYIDNHRTYTEMIQIRLGYENGLTDEQIKTYLGFNASQMEEIRLGYENGLTDEQVKTYTVITLAAEEMCKVRLKLEAEK